MSACSKCFLFDFTCRYAQSEEAFIRNALEFKVTPKAKADNNFKAPMHPRGKYDPRSPGNQDGPDDSLDLS